MLVHFPEKKVAASRVEIGEIYATLEAATRLRKRVQMKYQAATDQQWTTFLARELKIYSQMPAATAAPVCTN